jgi:hypothetical protein
MFAENKAARSKERKRRRAANRLGRRLSQLVVWWASVSVPKPTYLTASELRLSTDRPIQALSEALQKLGWKRIIRRFASKRIILWVPPGSPVKPRPRGRPRIYAS